MWFIDKFKIVISALYDENSRFRIKNKLGLYNNTSDEEYLKKLYKFRMGKELDLNNPKTFNEKLQWLKIHNRNPLYTTMVDKYAVKKYIADKIGEKYLIPTLGVWDNVEEIDFDKLPKQFVLKCTHDSGGIVICKDKSVLDYDKAKKKLKKSLESHFFLKWREWPYKDVKPRIIAEKFMEDDNANELVDYKVLCFNGEPKIIEVHKGRFNGQHTVDNYDVFWNKTDITQYNLPMTNEILSKPVFLEEMLSLSKVLSENIIHIRVDWYFIKGQLYFGELTFFDGSGFNLFCGDADELLGSWIKLPE